MQHVSWSRAEAELQKLRSAAEFSLGGLSRSSRCDEGEKPSLDNSSGEGILYPEVWLTSIAV